MTGYKTTKSLLVQHVPTHRVHTRPSSAQDNKNGSIYNAQHQTSSLALIYSEGNTGRGSPGTLLGEEIDDDDSRLELAQIPVKYAGLALPNTVNSATPNHQTRKDVCTPLINTLKDETTYEAVKHAKTMAAAKAAIRTSRDSLHKQELKRITDPIPAAPKRTIIRSQ